MDINDFLNNGVQVKNPNYKKPTKRNPSGSPRFIDSGNYDDAVDRNTRLGNTLAEQSYDLTGLNNDENKYAEYGVNLNPVNTQEELNQTRAKNQGALEQTGRFLGQAVGNEIVLGSALGLSNIVDFAANLGKEAGQDDYTNPLSTYLEDKQNEVRKALEIYKVNPNDSWQVGDYGWWADNAVSIASTLSMLIPSMAVTKGAGIAANLARLDKVSMGIAKAAKAGNFTKGAYTLSKAINAGAEIGTAALLSRTMEGYLEARGVYKEAYDKSLNTLNTMSVDDKAKLLQNNPEFVGKTNEEMASHMSSLSADETFKNDYAMLLFDVVQFKALGSMWKDMANKAVNSTLRTANRSAIASLVDDGGEVATKLGFLGRRKEILQHALRNPMTSLSAIQLTEGIEEGYQGIQTEKGKEVAEKILDPNFDARSLGSYLTDGHIWEQAFWGVIGGVGFQVAGTALGNASTAVKGKINKRTMTEQEYALSQMTDEKIREEEILSRQSRMRSYTDGMQLLNSNKNPFGYKIDPVTKQPMMEDGNNVNEDISADEAELLKTKLTNDFVTNMVLDATDKGNYDLLKEYVTNQNFNKFFEEAGMTSDTGDKSFSRMIVDKMDDTYENYHGALYDVLNSVDVENENVAKIVARDIARRKLEVNDLYNTSDELANQIALDADTSNYSQYEEQERLKYVQDNLNDIAKREDKINEMLTNKLISPQAVEQISKENDIRRNQLLAFGATGNMFGNPDAIKNILGNNIEDANVDEFIGEFNRYIKESGMDISSSVSEGAPKKSIQDIIKKKIKVDDQASYIDNTLPTTQAQYQSEYDDIARNVDRLTVERYNRAADIVSEYLESQPNLDEARDNILTNNVPDDIKKQLDILKLGHHSTQRFTAQINAVLGELSKDRAVAAEEARNVTVDDNTSNDVVAETEVQDIAEVVEATDNRPSDEDSSSTGKIEETSTESEVSNVPTAEVMPFDLEESIATIDKATDDFEKARADEFIVDNDARAIGLASSITFNLFKTSRNLFDNLEGKDVNSSEFNKIVSLVSEELFVQGVSRGYINVAARDGIKMALNMIHRRLSSKNISGSEMFKTLADQLATKHIVEQVDEAKPLTYQQIKEGDRVKQGNKTGTVERKENGKVIIAFDNGGRLEANPSIVELFKEDSTNSASTTKLIPDTEFNQVIDDFINSYINNKGVYTLKGSKTIINIEDLFRELLNNPEVSYEQARQVFFNIADYINARGNSKYIFINKTELNKNLKTPSIFFNGLLANKSVVEQIDTYMHIAAPSKTPEGYDKAVQKAIDGGSVSISYYSGEYGSSTNAISIKSGNVEIGYLGAVTPNSTNTGYSLKKQTKGFVYNLNNNNGLIESNLDKFFLPLINKESSQYSDLMDVAYKQFAYDTAIRNNSDSADISNEDVDRVISNPAIRNIIANEFIKIPSFATTNKQKAKYILSAINNILFYDVNAVTTPRVLESYAYWKSSTYNNYLNTHKLQQAIEGNKTINTKLVNISQGKVLIDAESHDVNTRGFTAEQNPIMIVDANGNIINEANNTSYNNTAGFESGTMGVLIADNPNAPIIALFTESNKLSNNKELANRAYNEISNLFNDFQTNKINFDTLGTALSDMFSGPGVKSNNLFSGYSVIKTANQIALNIQGRKGEYNLIVHKFEKKSNVEGTGITHIPNGDRSLSKSSLTLDKKFNNAIAKEIVSNLSFNKTFYAINNKNVDNDKSNKYLYKENGKLIVNLGGVSNTYNNFGDFVLSNNAFKTNQGLNPDGTYFDVKDRVKSLFINSATVSLPVEELSSLVSEQTATDLIKTATKTSSVNTTEVLGKAGVDIARVKVLTGDNQFGIELIPANAYYDSTATKAEAYYSKGKMFFTNVGANNIRKSPNNLVRLLLHENLHAKFEEQGLFQRDAIADDLLDTYNAMITAINNDTVSEDAKRIKKWVEDNKFNPIDYFSTLSAEQQRAWAKRDEIDRQLQFAEEWLVESLTQPTIIRYLNDTIYNGEAINVDGIDNSAKSIWQKIIDVLLRLFSKGSGNIKNNTILAQQYMILGDRSNNDSSAQSIVEQKVEQNENVNTNGETVITEETTVLEEEVVKEEDLSITAFQKQNEIVDEESNVDDLDFAITSMIDESQEDVKDGVDAIFSNTPELNNIGTKSQYSNYLSTIFPNSYLKNIAYHDTNIENKQFRKDDNGIFTTGQKNWWQSGTYKMLLMLDVNTPLTVEGGLNSIRSKDLLRNNPNNDTIITTGTTNDINQGVYVLRDPSQIHILGSNQDINKFKEFVNNNANVANSNITTDDINIEAYGFNANVNVNGVQIVTDMNKYVNQFPVQDRPRMIEMLASAELKFRCQ